MVLFPNENGGHGSNDFTRRPLSYLWVAAGMPCLLHSGGLRNDPHIDRKLDAIEAVETRRIPRSGGQYCLDQNNSKIHRGIRASLSPGEEEKYDSKNDEQ